MFITLIKNAEKNICNPRINEQLAIITCGINSGAFKLPNWTFFHETNEIIDNVNPNIIKNIPNNTNFKVEIFIILLTILITLLTIFTLYAYILASK